MKEFTEVYTIAAQKITIIKMINRTVLMSDAQHFRADDAINPYYADSHVDTMRAQDEHDAIRSALAEAGVRVIQVPSPATSQDGVYTANWALVRGSTAILARLPNVRKSEEAYARAQLEALGKTVVDIPDDLRFSGQGDALPYGSFLLCGKSYRSDEAAQAFAAKVLGLTKVQLETVPLLDLMGQPVINKISNWADSFYYDIDLAVAVIKEPGSTPHNRDEPGLIAYCPEALTEASIQQLVALPNTRLIEIAQHEAQEAFAANLVSTGNTVIMSSRAPLLAQAIRDQGLAVITPEISELAKGGGYIRCTSLTLD